MRMCAPPFMSNMGTRVHGDQGALGRVFTGDTSLVKETDRSPDSGKGTGRSVIIPRSTNCFLCAFLTRD